MDAFYASIEQRDDPSLHGKPVAVGGSEIRGVVASASYEARKFGVRSAMPSITAKRLCPDLVFVKHRFPVYKEVSRQIRDIFHEYTDLVEPLSLDEAYLDVTENKIGIPSATLIATEIRKKIFETTYLTASAGISFNKFLAKVASDINKPNGMKVILPEEAILFLEKLPVKKFFGIGKVTAKKMEKMGIHSGADLKRFSEIELAKHFGKAGRHFYRIIRAEDNREVNPNRVRKSIGAERTFSEDLTAMEDMKERLDKISEIVFRYMEQSDNYGRTVTLKAKTPAFVLITRSKSFGSEVRSLEALKQTVYMLLEESWEEMQVVRLLGVTVSNLEKENQEEGTQLEFEF